MGLLASENLCLLGVVLGGAGERYVSRMEAGEEGLGESTGSGTRSRAGVPPALCRWVWHPRGCVGSGSGWETTRL